MKESVPKDALQDLICCMHRFSGDWYEDRGWDTFYIDAKDDLKAGAAQHHKKFG